MSVSYFRATQQLKRGAVSTRRWASSSTAGAAASKSTNALGIAFFGSIVATAFGLGVWQTKRYFWKIDLIEETLERYNQDMGKGGQAIPLNVLQGSYAELCSHVTSMQGQKMALRGSFDHSREVLLGPRAAPPGLVTTAAQGMATNPMGYYLLTPFTLADGGHTVFVNRGWIPKNAAEEADEGLRKKYNVARPDGVVELGDIIGSKGEERGRFVPVNTASSVAARKLVHIEPAALERAAGLQVTTHAPGVASAKPASSSPSSSSWWWDWVGGGAPSVVEPESSAVKPARASGGGEGEEAFLKILGAEEPVVLLPAIVEVIAPNDAPATYPAARRYKQLAEFSVAPETHATYAVTWFSLATAGVFMTHRLFRGKVRRVPVPNPRTPPNKQASA